MINVLHNRLDRVAPRAVVSALALLGLSACDNPAPGEGMPKPLAEGPEPRVVPAAEALASPVLTAVDPGLLDPAEIDKVLPAGRRCRFAYTAESPAVLAVAELPGSANAQGVVKIHGLLVELKAAHERDPALGGTYTADGMRLTVKLESDPAEERQVADLTLELEQGLRVGYRGWYRCNDY